MHSRSLPRRPDAGGASPNLPLLPEISAAPAHPMNIDRPKACPRNESASGSPRGVCEIRSIPEGTRVLRGRGIAFIYPSGNLPLMALFAYGDGAQRGLTPEQRKAVVDVAAAIERAQRRPGRSIGDELAEAAKSSFEAAEGGPEAAAKD